MPKLNVKRTLIGLSIAFHLEALVLYIGAGLGILEILRGQGKSLVTDISFLLLLTIAGLFLTFAARAILKGKRWARSAGVFWQLIQLSIALGTYEASVIGAIAIALPSLAVLITLFQKDVVAATLGTRD
ncbi:MAG: hypothetical protein EBQ61_02515 [Micrococcales bacterium]|nr:hypothetical protein [Micrococcales bacterium]